MPSAIADSPLAPHDVITAFVSVLDGNRIVIRCGASTHLAIWDDVICVRSANKRTSITTTHGEYRVRDALAVVVASLAPLGLIRIHRAAAVNSTRVRQLIGHGRHQLTIVLDTGARFDVGRQFQAAIRARFASRRRAAGRQ